MRHSTGTVAVAKIVPWEAFAEFRAIGQRLDLERPMSGSRPTPGTARQWFLMPAASVRMHESVDRLAGPLVATIMLAVGLVLLVACYQHREPDARARNIEAS